MDDENTSISYATSPPLDSPGSPCRIERTADGLFITIPPPKLWVLLAGPAIGLLMAAAPTMLVAFVVLRLFRSRPALDVIGCWGVALGTVLAIAGYNLTRLIRAARFGQKSIHISLNTQEIIVERGIEGAEPESLPVNAKLAFYLSPSSPTMTFGRLIEMHFNSPAGQIDITFYSRQWKLPQLLQEVIVEELREICSKAPHAAC